MAVPSERESKTSSAYFGRTEARIGAIWLLCLITALLLVGLLGFDLWRSHRNLEQQAYREIRNLEEVYESHILGEVQGVQDMLAVFAEQVKLSDKSTPQGVRPGAEGYDAALLDALEERGRLLLQSLPAGNVFLFDAEGNVIASTSGLSRGYALGPLDFIRNALRDRDRREVFGTALNGPLTGRLVVPIAKAVYREDGTLIGIAATSILPAAFVQPFQSIDGSGARSVTVLQKDGLIVARAPQGDQFIGRSVAEGELFRKHVSQTSEGSVRIVGSLAARDLFIAYHALPDMPFVLISGLGADGVLAPWYHLLITYLILGSIAVLAIGACGWLLARDQSRRQAIATAGRIRTLIDGMSSFVMLFSAEGRILEINEGWLQTGVLTRDRVIGRHFWDTGWCAYSDQMAGRVRALIERAGVGEKLREDLVFRTGTDSYCTLDFTLQPVLQPDGTHSIIGSGFDVTDQRQLESKLRSSQKMEALGLLAGGIAHDFNNLLAAMSQFSQFLVEDLHQGTPQHGFAERLRRCCVQGKDIVAQILTYARPDAVQRQPLDLSTLAREIVETVELSCPETVLFETEVPDRSLTVVANPAQMTQILLNLCVNAIDAVDPDGRRREAGGGAAPGGDGPRGIVRLAMAVARPGDRQLPLRPRGLADPAAHYLSGTAEPETRYARLSVRDTGAGMTQQVLQRIFDPFFTTKTRGRGTGLGLAVVHSIVNSLGGLIEVESTPGEGSIFAIYLPLAEAQPARIEKPAAKRQAREHGHSILLVEDDADVAESIRIGLVRAGYAVTVAGDPAAAIAGMQAQPNGWELVITDQNLPGMKGVDLVRAIRSMHPGMLAILHTGSPDVARRDLSDEEGIDGFLRKPAEPQAMVAMIRALLERRRPPVPQKSGAAVAE